MHENAGSAPIGDLSGAPGRWWSDEELAAHDREVAAKALREAAALVYADWSGGHAYEGVARQEVEDWLCDRADRIESQASEQGAGDDPR